MRFHGSKRAAERGSTRLVRAIAALGVSAILNGSLGAHDLPLDPITPRGHSGAIRGVAFAPDGRTLVSVGAMGQARIWNVATGAVVADLKGHNGDILCVAVAPRGDLVATGGADKTIRLSRLSDGEAHQHNRRALGRRHGSFIHA